MESPVVYDEGRSRVTSIVPTSMPTTGVPRRRIGFLVGVWTIVAVASIALVIFGLGPLFQQREQRALLDSYRTTVDHASKASLGLNTGTAVTTAPEIGDPIAIVEIGGLQLRQVAVEGVSPSETERGPGHVPGTAAPGQPGNAVLVGRHSAFSGPFSDLDAAHEGDKILVTTTDGQSVYVVSSVGEHTVFTGPSAAAASSGGLGGGLGGSGLGGATAPADPLASDRVSTGDLYGPSTDNRLTLVTSASYSPLNSDRATVLIAKLDGKPFAPTPQGGRTESQNGFTGDATAWAPLALALLAYSVAVGAAIVLYRTSTPRVAYLITAPPLIAFTIIAAETLVRLFPGWM
jgi:sortase A